MKGIPTSFWAKLEKDDDGVIAAWHPLVDHCADVAAVFEALLAVPILRRRLAHLAGRADLDDVTRARLCVLVALHDLGKANIGFQAKGRPELGTTAGHVGEAVALLQSGPESFLEAIDARTLCSWGDATDGLLLAAICHHGRPRVHDAPGFQQSWWKPREGLDPHAAVASLAAAARRWFPKAFDEGPDLPDAPALQHAFAGLVMLADWIGSDSDEMLFPFSTETGTDRIGFARGRACRALSLIGVDIAPARASVIDAEPFGAIAPGLSPRSAQRTILELAVPEKGSVTILEAETGSGKTEAALARFVALFAAGQVDGMMFALPTRTAATQIFERVVRAVESAFVDSETRPSVVLAVPGYLRVDDRVGRRLPGFEVQWPDQAGRRTRYRGWAAENPKRFLAAPIVVGTVDQVLLSALMVPHAHLRAAALLRHLLVIDEVHASDAYMTAVLDAVLCTHQAAGGHALLLSATLGGEARAHLLSDRLPTLEEAKKTPYPLVSNTERRQSVHPVAHDGRQRSIDVETRAIIEQPAAIAQLALDSATAGAKVIVLRNTVSACLATQLQLERIASCSTPVFACNGIRAPHHSRYAREDRGALDRALEAQLGKNRSAGGTVVAATQTVQQSLDLDADLLITDICPIDVLLQRLGRLHRHLRERPSGFEQPRAIVLVPAERDMGSHIGKDGSARWQFGIGTVYEDLRQLEATWRLLEREPCWHIPAMCRDLVEQGLHSEILAQIVDEGGPAWKLHAAKVWGVAFGKRRMADLNLVDWSKPYCDIVYPSDRKIPSRLGEGDRRAIFPERLPSPFGQTVKELNIKASWASNVPPEVSEADRIVKGDNWFRFHFGPSPFIYDRLGLRPVNAVQPGPTEPRFPPEDDDEA